MKFWMSAGPSTPSSDDPNPCWKTRTRTPNVAPTESRFMRIALSGSRTDRNVNSSSR